MRLFYCPKCQREQKLASNPYKGEETIVNIRDGYGRPIRHYKCECGYYLAGSMDISGYDESDTNLYEQAKAAYERSHQK